MICKWRRFVLTPQGNPCEGTFVSPTGIKIWFQRNQLVVGGQHALNIRSGSLSYQDLHVETAVGPMGGLFAAVFSHPPQTPSTLCTPDTDNYDSFHDYIGAATVPSPLPDILGMVGYDAYGLSDAENRRFLLDWISNADLHIPDEFRSPPLLRAIQNLEEVA